MDFTAFDLPAPVLEAIREAGFVTTTPIQEAALPLALAGKDVAGQAQTGTGKTAAFLITVFTRLLRSRPEPSGTDGAAGADHRADPRAGGADRDTTPSGSASSPAFTIQAVYGGVDYAKQREALRDGVDVLIGTPGRLIDYFKQHVYTLKHVEVLVIDEADRMFDMGFIADLRFILRRLPPYDKRQNRCCSRRRCQPGRHGARLRVHERPGEGGGHARSR